MYDGKLDESLMTKRDKYINKEGTSTYKQTEAE